ncbi:MAG: DUF2069 domain-containing protein [Pseudomonadota bacterium]
MSARVLLVASLLALGALYLAWFAGRPYAAIAWSLLALPPLLLAVLVWRGVQRAGFLAALLALLWFSHGVMEAWANAADRAWALAAVALSLLVVGAASAPGLRARFGRRRR